MTATFKIGLGTASEGRHKDTNKKQFRARLSTGQFLEVQEGRPVTLAVNEVDESMLQNLASRDFVTLEEVATPQAVSRAR